MNEIEFKWPPMGIAYLLLPVDLGITRLQQPVKLNRQLL